MPDAALLAPHPHDAGTAPSATRSVSHVELLAVAQEAAWDAYVSRHPDGTIFHTLAWRNAVRATFNHEHCYLAAWCGQTLVGVLPLTLIASRLTGRRLTSVPYAVAGGILADDADTAQALFRRARELAVEQRCTLLELRSARAGVAELPVLDRYVGFQRILPTTPAEVLGWLPRKARAAARNARDKFGLTARFADEHLGTVWRLYACSMRRLGSINYPRRFFEELVARTPGQHWVSLIEWNGAPVAGLLTLLFRDTVLPYFVGVADAARVCHAANYVYLTLMERAVEYGYRVFDFGRTRRDNSGSYDFKRFHGFEPRPLQYQQYRPAGARATDWSPTNPRLQWGRRLWPRLPLCITRPLGAYLARHLPG
ncbi:MAG TPA: FemAB family PEP-CTERM system-associated protein [Phycisphaerae bacterium]|nr:FemAB family PEP-CTERM system-associated protein [Phycisphaerae bacterium]HNU45543.1 FemAB family PEP-CTERM system-associated protein [Phycisphaerae bacterium]